MFSALTLEVWTLCLDLTLPLSHFFSPLRVHVASFISADWLLLDSVSPQPQQPQQLA